MGKAIDVPDIGVRNSLEFHSFLISNSTQFQDLCVSKTLLGTHFQNIGQKSGTLSQNIDMRDKYV